jgi:hypothetical protein
LTSFFHLSLKVLYSSGGTAKNELPVSIIAGYDFVYP